MQGYRLSVKAINSVTKMKMERAAREGVRGFLWLGYLEVLQTHIFVFRCGMETQKYAEDIEIEINYL